MLIIEHVIEANIIPNFVFRCESILWSSVGYGFYWFTFVSMTFINDSYHFPSHFDLLYFIFVYVFRLVG